MMLARVFDFGSAMGWRRSAPHTLLGALIVFGAITGIRPASAQDIAAFERDFDQNIQRVPFAWILVKDDAGARQQLLDLTKAAYAKSGWPGANGAMLDWMGDRLPKVTGLALRADAAHIVAYGATMPPLLRALQDKPGRCKALLRDRDWPPYPIALKELTHAALALAEAYRAARASATVPWDALQAESEAEALLTKLSAGPVPIPPAELRALREPTLASDGVFCGAVIKLYENALALPEAQAAQAVAVIMSAVENGRWADARDASYGGDETSPINFRIEFDIGKHANPHFLVSIGPMAVLGVGA